MFRNTISNNIQKSFGNTIQRYEKGPSCYLTYEDWCGLFEEISKGDDREVFKAAVELQKSFTDYCVDTGTNFEYTTNVLAGSQRSLQLMKAILDRSKLVKKQITDKRGRLVTKWVKVEKDQKTQRPSGPIKEEESRDEQILAVTQDPNLNQTAKVKKLFELGIEDKKYVAEVTGANYSRVYQLWKQTQQGSTPSGTGGATVTPPKPPPAALPKIPVEDRWEAYEIFSDMVAKGIRKSAIAYGTGGVGKTFTLKKVLDKNDMLEFDEEINTPGENEYDYVKMTGKATPQAMYKALYEHNKKLIVFDDIDSVLTNEDSINILKGALDSTGDGTIIYDSSKDIKSTGGGTIPKRFKFQGTVVFISNLPPDKIPQPLRSRSLPIDLSMTASETVDRLRTIAPYMTFQDSRGEEFTVPKDSMDAAIDFLDKYKDKVDIGSLNARTFGSIALVHQQYQRSKTKNWESAALAVVGG